MRKKRAFTLLEIMIVIFLITLITGTIGYNMKGTLDRGRAFRTEQGQEQLHDLLLMCLADSNDPDAIASNPAGALKKTGLAKDPDKLVTDGWGKPFVITVTRDRSDFAIKSPELTKYLNKINKTQSNSSANVEEDE
jgi:general secretion pathway protein G